MKIAYFSIPGFGHIYPAIPLLQKLQKHRHDLTIFTSKHFLPLLKEAGIHADFQIYPDSLYDLFHSGSFDFTIAAKAYQEAKDYLPTLIKFFSHNNHDLIIHDSLAAWGKYISQATNIRGISYAVIPVYSTKQLFSKQSLPALSHHVFSDPIKNMISFQKCYAIYKQIMREYNLPAHSIFDIVKNTEPTNIIATHPALQPGAQELKNYTFVTPEYYTPKSSNVEKLLQTKKTVIYVSLGTVFNKNVGLLESLIPQLKQLSAEIFVGAASNHTVLKQYQDSNCHIFEHAPQLQILERADLFITHAGFNSANQALITATPVVAIPQAVDQFLTAALLVKSGCGIKLGQNPRAESVLRTAISVLENEKYRNQCQQLQQDFKSMRTLDWFSSTI